MKRSRRKLKLPDPSLPLRSLFDALPGLFWLVVLALAAWAWRPVSLAESVERADAAVREMEGEHGNPQD